MRVVRRYVVRGRVQGVGFRRRTEILARTLPIQGYIQNLSDEVDRLVLITEKLLMLSRADSNNLALVLTPFNLSVFLNELIEDASTFHPHLQFINHVQADVVWRCDHALIEQLINNLYTNAVKYNTPRGGWIAIHLQQTDTDIVLQFKNSSADVSPDAAARRAAISAAAKSSAR